jgi:acyl-CoA synthetase (AMP-forming)/AMP-acid ligase II
MVVLPFFYVMGKSLLNTHFAVGGTLVIHNAFAYTASVVRQMVDERVTGLSGVPSTYTHLLYRSPLAKYREKLTSLRYCAQAGGHMPRRVKEELRRVLPEHTDIYIMYGATEAGARLTCLEPGRFADKMDSIGKPLRNVTLRVIDDGGRECPDGETGELVASGPNIMRGYWKDSEGTARVLNENVYRTGDMGFRDSEGFYYLVGRRDHLIKVSGHRINPHEVEDALLSTGLLLETVVFAVPDPISGEKMVALATLKNGDCTGTDILCGCTERLPRYKIPKEVKIVRGLPKNSHGKIDLSRCREMMAGDPF